MKKLIVELSNERLITPSGMALFDSPEKTQISKIHTGSSRPTNTNEVLQELVKAYRNPWRRRIIFVVVHSKKVLNNKSQKAQEEKLCVN